MSQNTVESQVLGESGTGTMGGRENKKQNTVYTAGVRSV